MVAFVHRRVEHGRAHRRKAEGYISLPSTCRSFDLGTCPTRTPRSPSGQDDQAALPPTPQKPTGVFWGACRGQGMFVESKLSGSLPRYFMGPLAARPRVLGLPPCVNVKLSIYLISLVALFRRRAQGWPTTHFIARLQHARRLPKLWVFSSL